MATDGFVSFGSQGRGRVSVITLLGEQLGSRSPMSHCFGSGSGCRKEQGRAGSGWDRGCCHLVAVWGLYEEEVLLSWLLFPPQELGITGWRPPFSSACEAPSPSELSLYDQRGQHLDLHVLSKAYSPSCALQGTLELWEGQRGDHVRRWVGGTCRDTRADGDV